MFKDWNWKKILLNAFIIIFGFVYISDLRVDLAKSIVFCGMIFALVFLNKD